MIRESLNANARMALMQIRRDSWSNAYYRTSIGGYMLNYSSEWVPIPYWIKVSRLGDTVVSYVSEDGVNWVQRASVNISSLANDVYIGLAVGNWIDETQLTEAIFDGITVSGTGTDADWQSVDIGDVIVAGNTEKLTNTSVPTGEYSLVWNGVTDGGVTINPETNQSYTVEFWNPLCNVRYYDTTSVTIEPGPFVDSIAVDKDPFSPTGCDNNLLTITVEGKPNQVGLTYSIYSDNTYDIERNIALTESVAGSGIYSATWDGVPNTAYYYYYNGYIVPDGNYSIRVFNSSGAQSPITKSFSIDAIRSISSNPSSFCAATGESTTISFLAPKQQEIDVRFRHSVDGLVASVSAEERIVAVTEGYRVEGTGYLDQWSGTAYQDALRYCQLLWMRK